MNAADHTGEKIVSAHKAVFAQPPENTPCNAAVDGPLLGNGDTLAALGGSAEGLRFHINKNDLWVMKLPHESKPQPLAVLELSLPDMAGASYQVEQAMLTAVTSGRFEKGPRTLLMEAYVCAVENLLVVKLEARGGAIAATMRLDTPANVLSGETANLFDKDQVQVAQRVFDKDVIVTAGAACAVKNPGPDGSFVLEPGKPVTIAAAVCSIFDEKDYCAAAIHQALSVDDSRLAELRQSHEQWWRAFWDESFVEIPDKALEQRYYLSNYVLASASRVKDFPPGLFGWVTNDDPMWAGDYHTNYNHVATFYGLYAANHIAQADPCHQPFLDGLDFYRRWCREELGVEGVYQPVGIGPKGSVAYLIALMQKSNSAYSCVPMAFRWYATYDLDFARQVWPFVSGTALFWENWLKFENGRYVIYQDAVHEGSGDDINPIVSLGFVRMVMDLALDISRELGVDAPRRAKWQHIRDHISDYPACTVRDLPEKFWPRHLPHDEGTLSLPIFRYTEKGTPWWADNTVGLQHIYPAGGIGLDSPPELLDRSRNQITVMARWDDFNGKNSIYAAAARVGYDPHVILDEMRNMLADIGLPNGMIRGNPHGMENQSIVPNAIQEMLLQSHDGVLRFFPCWPGEMDGRFGSLRARGAFLVWARLAGGQVRDVKILSEKGRDCTVVNPWPGKPVALHRNGKAAETFRADRFAFKTSRGEHLALAPQAGHTPLSH
ncbi:MAG: glycoside hydrolase family 95-like protein [Planctomycetaceae bacterium]|nr:hypothetical protein [Planctomycetaceae bacterium]